MKKRIRCYFLFLVCMALLLSACSINDTNSTPPVQESTASTGSTGSTERTDSTDSTASTDGAIKMLPLEYDAIINHIIHAYPWNDDDQTMVPENPELSYMYRRSDSLADIGFALIDLDDNGQEELIIADISTPFLFDLYTISDGKAVHLADSGERYQYYVCENGYLEYQWSGGAGLSGHDFYQIKDGSLCFVERITMDANHALNIGLIEDIAEANDNAYYFRSTSDQYEDYEFISPDEATNAIEAYQNANKPLVIEYTLLSEY